MAAVAFASVARQDVENARLMIPSLVQAQQLNEDQTQELRDIVAWRLMGSDVTEEQAIWRDDAIMRSQSTPLVERRVRMALGTGDRHGLNTGWRACRWRRKRKTNGATGRRICCWSAAGMRRRRRSFAR